MIWSGKIQSVKIQLTAHLFLSGIPKAAWCQPACLPRAPGDKHRQPGLHRALPGPRSTAGRAIAGSRQHRLRHGSYRAQVEVSINASMLLVLLLYGLQQETSVSSNAAVQLIVSVLQIPYAPGGSLVTCCMLRHYSSRAIHWTLGRNVCVATRLDEDASAGQHQAGLSCHTPLDGSLHIYNASEAHPVVILVAMFVCSTSSVQPTQDKLVLSFVK